MLACKQTLTSLKKKIHVRLINNSMFVVLLQSNQKTEIWAWRDGNGLQQHILRGHTRSIRYMYTYINKFLVLSLHVYYKYKLEGITMIYFSEITLKKRLCLLFHMQIYQWNSGLLASSRMSQTLSMLNRIIFGSS